MSQVFFLIVGEGPDRPGLENLCKDLGLQSQVIFLGKRIDIPAILCASDIGVLSSKSESFSNAVVEYMAAGVPVVATDVGGVREAVDEAVNGYVVPTGNYKQLAEQIVEVVCSGAMKQMGENSRTVSSKMFTLDKMIDETQKMYIGKV